MVMPVFDPLKVQPYQPKRLDIPQGPNLNAMGYLAQAGTKAIGDIAARRQGITLKQMEGDAALERQKLANEASLAAAEEESRGRIEATRVADELARDKWNVSQQANKQAFVSFLSAIDKGDTNAAIELATDLTADDLDRATKLGYNIESIKNLRSDRALTDENIESKQYDNAVREATNEAMIKDKLSTYSYNTQKTLFQSKGLENSMRFLSDPNNANIIQKSIEAGYREGPIANAHSQAMTALAEEQAINSQYNRLLKPTPEQVRKQNLATEKRIDAFIELADVAQAEKESVSRDADRVAADNKMVNVSNAKQSITDQLTDTIISTGQFNEQQAVDMVQNLQPLIDNYVASVGEGTPASWNKQKYIANPFLDSEFIRNMQQFDITSTAEDVGPSYGARSPLARSQRTRQRKDIPRLTPDNFINYASNVLNRYGSPGAVSENSNLLRQRMKGHERINKFVHFGKNLVGDLTLGYYDPNKPTGRDLEDESIKILRQSGAFNPAGYYR